MIYPPFNFKCISTFAREGCTIVTRLVICKFPLSKRSTGHLSLFIPRFNCFVERIERDFCAPFALHLNRS